MPGQGGAAAAGTAPALPWAAHCTSAPILSSDDAGAAIRASHFGQLSDGQSLVRRTLPGSLAVSTELANRAVSSMCLAGLCDWPLACVSFGFDSSSPSSTVGFRDILFLRDLSRLQLRSCELVAVLRELWVCPTPFRSRPQRNKITAGSLAAARLAPDHDGLAVFQSTGDAR